MYLQTAADGIVTNLASLVDAWDDESDTNYRASFESTVTTEEALRRSPAEPMAHYVMAAALRAYKELNLRALRLLRPGGLLFTCSCSGRLSPQDFGGMLREAAADARREVQLLERRGAGLDHPVLLGLSETEYLKCWVLKALG